MGGRKKRDPRRLPMLTIASVGASLEAGTCGVWQFLFEGTKNGRSQGPLGAASSSTWGRLLPVPVIDQGHAISWARRGGD